MIKIIVSIILVVIGIITFGYLWFINHKQNCKLYKLVTLIFALSLVLLLPILINEFYIWENKTGEGYHTLWDAKDVLSFYGSFLAFIGTVILGALALYQNQNFDRSNRIQNRLSIRPYLFTSIKYENLLLLSDSDICYYSVEIDNTGVYHKGLTQGKPTELTKYLQCKNTYENLLHENDKCNATEKQLDLLKAKEETDNMLITLNKKYILLSYKLTNYGNAAAIRIKILLNNRSFAPSFSLSKDSNVTLYFLYNCKDLSSYDKRDLLFTFTYYDIEGYGPYTQEEHMSINRSQNSLLKLTYKDQISDPN